MYIPNDSQLRLRILQKYYDSPVAGHPGRDKTFTLVAHFFFWAHIREHIGQYVQNCQSCMLAKAPTHAKYGFLRPLPVPNQMWQEVSMDFLTGLPTSEEYDAILVVVDRLTKMRHLIACTTTANAADVAKLYLNTVWKYHGIPTHITSDRGTQFIAQFWQSLLKQIKARMSTPYHPETDGQTERLNAVMEQYLRHYVFYQQEDWATWLPMAQFAANNQESSTTRVSLFFANYGFHPRFDLDLTRQGSSPQLLDAKEFASRMADLNGYLQVQMRVAQDRYESLVNKSRLSAPPV